MINRPNKVWGRTTEVLKKPHVEVHLLEILKGGYCSEHRHLHKVNAFHVISGRLEVLTWHPDMPDAPAKMELGPGDRGAVFPGLFHRFRAIEETTALEIYELEDLAEDIDRRTQGGLGEEHKWAGLP